MGISRQAQANRPHRRYIRVNCTGGTFRKDTGIRFCRGYLPIGGPRQTVGDTEKEL